MNLHGSCFELAVYTVQGELSEEKEHVEDLTAKHQLELANRTRLQRQCTQ